jgi:2-oxoglutarate/2-oxoacid ferredoxin oxidoreductase subunit alpha
MGQREKPQVQADVAERVEYRRYALTASGVSPMAVPGMAGCAYTADGLTHNEAGNPSSQASHHLEQLDKRLHKLTAYNYGDHWADISGDEDAETAVITWGSCAGPVHEALERLEDAGESTRMIAMRLLSPPQPEKLARALAGVKRVLVVEQTHSGQFHRYLRAHYDLPGEVRALHHAGPLPMRPGEVVAQLTDWR